ncbi:translocation/assembly module TamB [Bacteroides sp. 214]|uniref:translocation/assembly module TamB domain-containing protein n=1 Tax=Bacteroides sp. 214 TaxID=2302935 RepID=UPI0019402B34|nr:translocation/assembly module TamB domain-containing protein [Bacteroides sp. 214]NDW13853.1 translocation/assembly module TamB [Bacteroides sp. 214]
MVNKRIKKVLLWIVLTPFVLVLLLSVLIYIPPVQRFLQREVTAYVSKSTKRQISIADFSLRFPFHLLAKNVCVVQDADTILSVESLGLNVKMKPLFRGRIEAKGVFLENGIVNTASLIGGMQLFGSIGRVDIEPDAIDWGGKLAALGVVELKNTRLKLLMTDTTSTSTNTPQASLPWLITLDALKLDNLTFALDMVADTLQFSTYINKSSVEGVAIDLGKSAYTVNSIRIDKSAVLYDQGKALPAEGLDPAHIYLSNLDVEVDSVYNCGIETKAIIRNIAMKERSGIKIAKLAGNLYVDSTHVRVPELLCKTAYSSVNLSAKTEWDVSDFNFRGLKADLNAKIGKGDMLLLMGKQSEELLVDYPEEPLAVQLAVSGSTDNMNLANLSAELPGAFKLQSDGKVVDFTDSIRRSGYMNMRLETEELPFVLAFAGLTPNNNIVIPVGMTATGEVTLKGAEYAVNLLATESVGKVLLNANYNTMTQAYNADLSIDSLRIDHFMPKDSIYTLSITAKATGNGADFKSVASTAKVDVLLNRLEYKHYELTDINLEANLKRSVATARFNSNNSLATMELWGEYRLNSKYTEARAAVNIADVDVYQLGFIDRPMKKSLPLIMSVDINKEATSVLLYSGDLEAKLNAKGPLENLIEQSTGFVSVLQKQIASRLMNHVEIREILPTASFTLKAGKDNILNRYAALQNISFSDAFIDLETTPEVGINGLASIHTLKIDTIKLDTLSFATYQDTTSLKFRSDVVSRPKIVQNHFSASLTGEIRDDDAEALIQFNGFDGETGILFGANVQAVERGIRMKFIPEKPIVAFRQFEFKEHNRIFIRNNGRVLANVEMLDKHGMGVRIHSMPDTTFLQNLDIEIRRIELGEISKVLPYYPAFSGLFSAEANFKQTPNEIQLSTEAHIKDLTYDKKPAGDVRLALAWLPGANSTHYLDGYLELDEHQIMLANGSYQTGVRSKVDVSATAEHFPLKLANLFMPEELLSLSGDIDGEILITGTTDKPVINGELVTDEVLLNSDLYGLKLSFENKVLPIKNNRLQFDKYAIYATGDNPFTIDGYIDMKNYTTPVISLDLLAKNYKLLDAKRKDGRLLYGKIFFDMNSTVRGSIDNLKMRGNVKILNDTDVKYVLTDSPLTVQDRLGDLVVFTSFSDPEADNEAKTQTVSMTGIDVSLNINVDRSVEVGVDLSTDRSSYVDLEGGGNLTFRYTAQGDMNLTGRYVLADGRMKYSLPVIPLKEFDIDADSYVEWTGNPMDPNLNFKATERMRVSVGNTDGSTRMVNFDVSILVKNKLNDLQLIFDLEAPEDAEVKQQLAAMDLEERSKQAVAMMATGIYLAGAKGSGFDMGTALNNVLQSQISNLAGSALKTVNISFGMDNYEGSDGKRTDYNFKYSQRFFNDRIQVVVGGSISTGNNAEETESFIDNVSLEYRLDKSGTRYVRLFHNKNFESVLEGEIVETGVGLVLRKKVNKLGELFIFSKSK